jgi:hypothetical protein
MVMAWKPLRLPKSPDQIKGKPFKEYTEGDWKSYHGWAARSLRVCADQSEEQGKPEQSGRERASADEHERWATE